MTATAHEDDRLARLEEGQDALVRGVAQMNETLATHAAMLERILLAAAEEAPGGGDLAEALREMAPPARQKAVMVRLEICLAALPARSPVPIVTGAAELRRRPCDLLHDRHGGGHRGIVGHARIKLRHLYPSL